MAPLTDFKESRFVTRMVPGNVILKGTNEARSPIFNMVIKPCVVTSRTSSMLNATNDLTKRNMEANLKV